MIKKEGDIIPDIKDNEKYIFDTYTGKPIELLTDSTYNSVGRETRNGNIK